jgi:hypothetical protein
MTRSLVVAVTLTAALLLLAAPAGAVDPLTLTSSSPRDRASVPLTPTGGIPWQIATSGVPDDAGVSVTISGDPTTGPDGTLATESRVDFFFLTPSGTPNGWSGKSDPGPDAWSATAGTYYWQVIATWTDAAGVFHRTATDVARLFLGIPAPAAPGTTPAPGAGGGPTRTSLRMSTLDARYYVRTVIRRHTKRSAARLRYGCTRRTAQVFRCRPTWRDSRNLYSATATFTHVRRGGRVVTQATVTGRRASRQCTRTRTVAACSLPFRWRSTLATRPAGVR